MYNSRFLMPLDTMERITRQHLCDNFDEILARVNKENVGFVILDPDGKDGQVLCPAAWMDYCFDDDFGCIINSALRYAIGRHTYMPGVVVNFVRKYIHVLDSKTIHVAIEDIQKNIEWNNVDNPEMWQTLKEALETRLAYLHERDAALREADINKPSKT